MCVRDMHTQSGRVCTAVLSKWRLIRYPVTDHTDQQQLKKLYIVKPPLVMRATTRPSKGRPRGSRHHHNVVLQLDLRVQVGTVLAQGQPLWHLAKAREGLQGVCLTSPARQFSCAVGSAGPSKKISPCAASSCTAARLHGLGTVERLFRASACT